VARQALSAVRSGWGNAAVAAVAVLAIVLVLNLLLAWLQQEAASRIVPLVGEPAVYPFAQPGLVRSALLSMMFWHGVSLDIGVVFQVGSGIPFGTSIGASVTATLLLGMAITGYLLFLAGRWIAVRKGQAGWLAGAGGLQVALIYAVLTLVIAIVSGLEIPLPEVAAEEGPSSVSVQPSLLGAFFMPFLLASLAAGAGAFQGRLLPNGRIARMTLAAIAGGWRAAWVAVALASIGFLIVAALNPDETRAYLDLLPGGGLSRFFLIISTLLLVPNMGTGIAAAAMGGSINVTNLTSFRDSCAFISYMKFPGGIAEPAGAPLTECSIPIELGPAPFQYLLFLLVPLAATFAGGWLASQRSGARDAEDGAVAGAMIALPYALGLWALALVARLGYSAAAGTFPFELRLWIGPGLFSTVLLAIVWGVAGGALGGAFGARKANGPGTSPSPPVNLSG
jgi:hypothetical protein